MNVSRPTDGYPHPFARTFDMLRRRHQAAQRIMPNADGVRDSLYKPLRPTMDPATIVEIARIGGLLSRAQYRAAWFAHPEHRELLDAVAAAQHEGWPA